MNSLQLKDIFSSLNINNFNNNIKSPSNNMNFNMNNISNNNNMNNKFNNKTSSNPNPDNVELFYTNIEKVIKS